MQHPTRRELLPPRVIECMALLMMPSGAREPEDQPISNR
jgi:hypothetical protein